MPPPDYFGSLGFKPRLSLDADELQRRFYELSRRLHPDRFARATPAERQRALEESSILNDAYRTLRDPISRAEYFLKWRGFDLDEKGRQAPRELLEEVFELNTALEEFSSGDAGARSRLQEAHRRLARLREETDAALQRLFESYDQDQDTGVLGEIRELLDRRRYIGNLERQLENAGAVSD